MRRYLLLVFYMQKLNDAELEYLPSSLAKDFGEELWKYTQDLQSHKELSRYREDVQKLVLKLMDNEHAPLHLVGNYMADDDYHEEVEEYMVEISLERLNSSNEVKQENPQTHHYIKSNYLLQGGPPQI